MKLLTIAIVCVFCVHQVIGRDKEKERELARKLLVDCKKIEGGSDEDFDKMVKEEFPNTKEGNCMMACAYEKLGIFADGVFSRDTFLFIAKMIVENDEVQMSYAAQVADQCGNAEGERCDQAFNFTKCLHDAIKTIHVDVEIV